MEVVRPRQVVKVTIAMLAGALLALIVCYPDWIWDLRPSILPKGIDAVSKWIESHPGLAGWVQAVGSIAAIVFSLRVARRQTAAQERIELARRENEVADRRRAAHRVAVDHVIVIAPDVFRWAVELEKIQVAIEAADSNQKDDVIIGAVIASHEIGVPTSVQNLLGRFHEMQGAADCLQKAVVSTRTVALAKNQIDLVRKGDIPSDFVVAEFFNLIEKSVRAQIIVVQHASEVIRKYYVGRDWRDFPEED